MSSWTGVRNTTSVFQSINQSINRSIDQTKKYGFLYPTDVRDPRPPVNLTYRGTTLAIKDEAKMLGVAFDHNLNFDKHVANVPNAAERTLAYISKIIGKDWGDSTGDTRAASLSKVWPILTNACNIRVPLLNERVFTKLRRTLHGPSHR